MIEAFALISEHGPIDTGTLAEMMGVDRTALFSTLNAAAKGDTLIRHGLFVENDKPRPTLCFGWSCPAD